jgi:hypothetical protein
VHGYVQPKTFFSVLHHIDQWILDETEVKTMATSKQLQTRDKGLDAPDKSKWSIGTKIIVDVVRSSFERSEDRNINNLIKDFLSIAEDSMTDNII